MSTDLLSVFCSSIIDDPVPVAVFDSELTLKWINRQAEEMMPAVYHNGGISPLQKDQILQNLDRYGVTLLSEDIFSGASGSVIFFKTGDNIVSYIMTAQGAAFGGDRFQIDGIDSFTEIVRSNIDNITLAAKSIERMLDGENSMRDTFDSIRRSCYTILRNTQNSALLSRFKSGLLGLHRDCCNVNELCAAVCLAAQSVCSNNIPIQLSLPAEALITEMDVRLCERSLLNVLLNSMVYTRDGNEIHLTLSQSAGQIVFTIKDRGAGIQKENLAEITKLYFSREPANDSEIPPGMGLGLPIAAAFCQLHGGTLMVDSEFGEGTTVALSIKKIEPSGETVLKSSVASYITDAFSPVYIELSGVCEIPY